MSKFVIIVVCFSLGLAGYMIWTGYNQIGTDTADVKAMAASVDWPTTKGLITESTIEVGKGSKDRPTYTPTISYRYTVAGKPYESTQVSYGTTMVYAADKKEEAQWVTNLYPKGSQHTVHYSPTKFTEAVLVPGISPTELTLPGLVNLWIGVAIVPISFAFAFFLGKSYSQRHKLYFVLSFVACMIGAISALRMHQSNIVTSIVPDQKILQCKDDGYYLGAKKFSY
ncbi:MAG: DUF3592 domain-containing protein [Candidatus Melainabacteria bacterium]|nr:DUF3592 domain-containing protein [Candidatus Melainabacteria bacterium]